MEEEGSSNAWQFAGTCGIVTRGTHGFANFLSEKDQVKEQGFIPLDFRHYPPEAMAARAAEFAAEMSRRRSVRQFSSRPVPLTIIQDGWRAAGRAPSSQ
ncbi:MAG: hypothetical protein ACP5UQ_10240 [Anaerolineae bacterium]